MTDSILYHVPRYSTHSVGTNKALLVTTGGQEVLEVDVAVTRLLGLCDGARTVGSHVEEVTRVTGWPARAVRASINGLLRAGLLKPVAGSPAAAPQSPPLAIASICIVTADRPDLLSRCLTDAVDHTLEHQRQPRIFVLDGSQDSERRLKTKVAVQKEQDRASITYIGPGEADAIASRFGPPDGNSDLLKFALCAGTAGANRNLALLLTAGQSIAIVDDDTRWIPWRPAIQESSVSFSGHRNMCRWAFFPDQATCYDAAPAMPTDLLRVHETLLGRDLRMLASGDVNMTAACNHLLAELATQDSPTVRLTLTGAAGHRRFYCPDRLMFLDDMTSSSLDRTADLPDDVLSHPHVHRISEGPVITHDCRYNSGFLGVDNTDILPPFLPVGLNEDGVYGAPLLSKLGADDRQANAPG